jgi:fumarate hydratase class II
MAATQVMAHDAAVAMAGASGNFQLNVMLPLIAHALLESVTLIGDSADALAKRAIPDLTVHGARLSETLARNPMLLTALAAHRSRAAAIAKRAATVEIDSRHCGREIGLLAHARACWTRRTAREVPGSYMLRPR